MGTDSEAERTRLKFGVDRILSEEIGTRTKQREYTTTDVCCDWTACGRCVALRCCLKEGSPQSQYYPSSFFQSPVLHAPKPIRPFPAKFQLKVTYENLGVIRDSEDRSGGSKRKRSWSRAVFSSLQRKGLEKRFQLQQYITKPDRRQLAATLGLTDAQVKVWFQNRRMKWRHTKELKGSGVVICQQRLSATAPQPGQGHGG